MIDARTQAQFADDLAAALLAVTTRWDVGFDFVYDLHQALSAVLETQHNDRLRKVDQRLDLSNVDGLSDAEVDARVSDEGIVRQTGTQSLIVGTFYTTATPTTFTLPQGFPVGTTISSSASRIVFVTTETKTDANMVYNPVTRRNELQVSMVSLSTGESGRIGPNKATVPLRVLPGNLEGVTNTDRASGGAAALSNAALVELYLLAITSRQLSAATGAEFFIRDQYQTLVEDTRETFGTDPDLLRDEPGAVDVHVIGSVAETFTAEAVTCLGIGVTCPIANKPLIDVLTVYNTASSTTMAEGTDYEIVHDYSGPYGGSIKALDGIRALPGGAIATGDELQVTYTANTLIPTIQTKMEEDETYVHGRDLLVKAGQQIDLLITGTISAASSRFSATSMVPLVKAAILSTVNALKLHETLEMSDLQKAVRQITGVGNFVITNARRASGTGTSTADITFASYEFGRIVDASITITAV